MSFSSDKPLQSNQLPISSDIPDVKSKDFSDTLSLLYKRIANSVNTKEGSLYLTEELATFKSFFINNNPQKFRNGYRMTYDLVDLNGGVIPAGVTTLSVPDTIEGLQEPIMGYGAGTIDGPIYVFNGDDFNVRFDNTDEAEQNIIITNNTGSDLITLIWVFEYLKEV